MLDAILRTRRSGRGERIQSAIGIRKEQRPTLGRGKAVGRNPFIQVLRSSGGAYEGLGVEWGEFPIAIRKN